MVQIVQTLLAAQPRPYKAIALPLMRLGYAVLPRKPGGKAPTVSYGWLTGASASSVLEEFREWFREFGRLDGGLWLLDSLDGGPDLDAIDYDDLAELPWGVSLFGTSPLTQTTGREGGGVHHLFRRDPRRPRDERGSKTKIGGHQVDHKTWHGYIVAPHTVHASGRAYRLFWNGEPLDPKDLTREMLESLPILDRDVLDKVIGEAPGVGTVTDPQDRTLRVHVGGRGGKYPKVKVKADARMPAGQWSGQTVEGVAAGLGTGECTIACPHAGHTHRTDLGGGTSAILHAEGGRPTHLTCFACSTTYTYGGSARRGEAPPPSAVAWSTLGWDEEGEVLPAVVRLAAIPVPLVPIVYEGDEEGILEEGVGEVSESPDVPPSPSEFSDTSLSGAETRLLTIGRIVPRCKRGSSRVVASATKIEAVYQPCGARSCPACGPAIARAETAAAGSIFAELGENGLSGLIVAGNLAPYDRKRIAKWQADDPENRCLLVVPLAGEDGEPIAILTSGDGFDTLNERKRRSTAPIEGELVEAGELGDRVQALLLGRRGSLASGSHGLQGDRGLVRATWLAPNPGINLADVLLGLVNRGIIPTLSRPVRGTPTPKALDPRFAPTPTELLEEMIAEALAA